MTADVRIGELAQRLWNKDVSLWTSDESTARSVGNRLGWISVLDEMLGAVPELRTLADEVRQAGIHDLVLLGMGGSSLAPEVISGVFGSSPGYPKLTVLDSTDPDTVCGIRANLDLDHSLFIVATKSGTTTETRSFYEYFWKETSAAVGKTVGDHFIAITDPGTALASEAKDRGFRRVFLNPADIGGRYSALSYFGLVPAALIGVDVGGLLRDAEQAKDRWLSQGDDNEAVRLGAALAEQWESGRDKMTLITSSTLNGFGDWAEQLVAESTGKHGVGIVPVVGEPIGAPTSYGNDRVFVAISVEADDTSFMTATLATIESAGHPVIRWSLPSPLSLGSEFLRWEIATAVAGALMKINPFDEPNVQESKDNTSRLLKQFVQDGVLPESSPILTQGDIEVFGSVPYPSAADALGDLISKARDGSYFAIMAYCERSPEIDHALEEIRRSVRDRLRVATTVGYGPRFLHSTGQLHKGGAAKGVFLQITAEDATDAEVPGQPYSFAVLKRAQAIGDFEALRGRDLPALRLHISGNVALGMSGIHGAIRDVAADRSFHD